MSVTAVATVPKTATSNVTTPVVATKKTLGSEDFMKLLAVQFQSQDPMKPMDDTAFIAQMAQFSSLSQSQTMTTEMAKLSANQALATANSYLNQNVVVSDGQGGTASGQVSGVQVGKDGPRIVVGDYTYDLSAVLSVQPPTTSTTIPAGSTGGV